MTLTAAGEVQVIRRSCTNPSFRTGLGKSRLTRAFAVRITENQMGTRAMGHRLIGAVILAISLVLVSGCTTPTILRIVLVADAGVNPDINGRASPIVVKLYEMKSLTAFNSADFFSLFNKDQDTLGAELVAREDLQLRPSENRKIERQIRDETRYFGAVAAFRDLERARWRAAITVPEHKKTLVTIQIGARGISIQAQ